MNMETLDIDALKTTLNHCNKRQPMLKNRLLLQNQDVEYSEENVSFSDSTSALHVAWGLMANGDFDSLSQHSHYVAYSSNHIHAKEISAELGANFHQKEKVDWVLLNLFVLDLLPVISQKIYRMFFIGKTQLDLLLSSGPLEVRANRFKIDYMRQHYIVLRVLSLYNIGLIVSVIWISTIKFDSVQQLRLFTCLLVSTLLDAMFVSTVTVLLKNILLPLSIHSQLEQIQKILQEGFRAHYDGLIQITVRKASIATTSMSTEATPSFTSNSLQLITSTWGKNDQGCLVFEPTRSLRQEGAVLGSASLKRNLVDSSDEQHDPSVLTNMFFTYFTVANNVVHNYPSRNIMKGFTSVWPKASLKKMIGGKSMSMMGMFLVVGLWVRLPEFARDMTLSLLLWGFTLAVAVLHVQLFDINNGFIALPSVLLLLVGGVVWAARRWGAGIGLGVEVESVVWDIARDDSMKFCPPFCKSIDKFGDDVDCLGLVSADSAQNSRSTTPERRLRFGVVVEKGSRVSPENEDRDEVVVKPYGQFPPISVSKSISTTSFGSLMVEEKESLPKRNQVFPYDSRKFSDSNLKGRGDSETIGIRSTNNNENNVNDTDGGVEMRSPQGLLSNNRVSNATSMKNMDEGSTFWSASFSGKKLSQIKPNDTKEGENVSIDGVPGRDNNSSIPSFNNFPSSNTTNIDGSMWAVSRNGASRRPSSDRGVEVLAQGKVKIHSIVPIVEMETQRNHNTGQRMRNDKKKSSDLFDNYYDQVIDVDDETEQEVGVLDEDLVRQWTDVLDSTMEDRDEEMDVNNSVSQFLSSLRNTNINVGSGVNNRSSSSNVLKNGKSGAAIARPPVKFSKQNLSPLAGTKLKRNIVVDIKSTIAKVKVKWTMKDLEDDETADIPLDEDEDYGVDDDDDEEDKVADEDSRNEDADDELPIEFSSDSDSDCERK